MALILVLFAVGKSDLVRAYNNRMALILMGLSELETLGVGIFPGDIIPLYPLFAFTTFISGGLYAICRLDLIKINFAT